MSANLTLSDAEKSITMTVASAACEEDDQNVVALTSALEQVNALMPIASISLSGMTYTVTLKDARTFAVTVQSGTPPTSQITSASYWNHNEIDALQVLETAMMTLLMVEGMTALTITYA